jgi:hypothetical protein
MTPAESRPEAADVTAAPAAMRQRIVVASLFVLAWVVIGRLARLGPNAYLLVGIPLTVLFQRYVHKKPIWRAWVTTGLRPQPDLAGWACGLALALLPVACLLLPAWTPFASAGQIDKALWLVAASIGGLAAGLVVRRQPAAAWRRSAPYAVMALSCGVLIFSVAGWQAGHLGTLLHARGDVATLLGTSVLYFDVNFVVEEVTFRGVLDPYLLGNERGQAAPYVSAVAGSALWGLWHLPLLMAGGLADGVTVLRVVLTHASFGVVLCFAVRSAGTLVPGALAHAISDAYRNLLS